MKIGDAKPKGLSLNDMTAGCRLRCVSLFFVPEMAIPVAILIPLEYIRKEEELFFSFSITFLQN